MFVLIIYHLTIYLARLLGAILHSKLYKVVGYVIMTGVHKADCEMTGESAGHMPRESRRSKARNLAALFIKMGFMFAPL